MNTDDSPKLTPLGKLAVLLFVAGCLYGAWHFFLQKKGGGGGAPSTTEAKSSGGGLFGGATVEIGVAYGTEKQRWLEWAQQEFAKTDAGRRIQVNLIPLGSVEGAQAILRGDQRIQAWTPASALYKDVFVQEW